MRVLCRVSYKGTNYQGWQKQKDAPTVQGTIESVLSKILNTEIQIQGSGRTDAGVHAINQYFHFDLEKDVDLGRLRYSANCLLPEDIFIKEIKPVSDDFHARFSGKGKHYQYIIQLGERNAFNYDLETNIPYEINANLLQKSLKKCEGKHNFQDFTSKEEDDDSFVRTIYSIDVENQLDHIYINFYGDGFMRYQIRDIVGSALAIACEKEPLEYMDKHLQDKKEREIVSYKAPAEGLYLVDVDY